MNDSELDDWKAAWAAHGERIDRAIGATERLVRKDSIRDARRALAPSVAVRAVEVAAAGAAAIGTALLLARHAAEPRYLVAGGATLVYLGGLCAVSAALLARTLRLDLGAPITAVQRDLAALQRAEYRATLWAVLAGVLVWLPAALLLFEAATGVDALARVDLAYLTSNLVLGVAVLALGVGWSRRRVEREDAPPWARRLIVALSGRGLRVASDRIAEVAAFVDEAR